MGFFISLRSLFYMGLESLHRGIAREYFLWGLEQVGTTHHAFREIQDPQIEDHTF